MRKGYSEGISTWKGEAKKGKHGKAVQINI